MKYRNIIFVISFLLQLPSVYGQSINYKNFRVQDGLPSDEVYDLEVDSLNRIWITTDRGVAVYDGNGFKIYTTDDGLADNTNFEIFKDSNNRMWFNGFSSAISYYENGAFHEYEYNDVIKNYVVEYEGYFISEIRQTSDSKFTFSPFHNKSAIQIISIDNHEPIIERIPVKMGNNFKITDSSYHLIKEQKVHFALRSLTLRSNVLIEELPLIINTNNEKKYLYKTPFSVITKDEQYNITSEYTFDVSIENLYLDKSKNLWVCTSAGVYYFKEGILEQKPTKYFGDYRISSIKEDLNSNYWISTNQNGIFLIPNFSIKKLETANVKELENRNYVSVKRMTNHLLFGSNKSMIMYLDKDLNKYSHFIDLDNQSVQVKNFNPSINPNELNIGEYLQISDSEHSLKFNYIKNPLGKVLGLKNLLLDNGEILYFSRSGMRVLDRNLKDTTFFDAWHKSLTKEAITKVTNYIQDRNETIWFYSLDGLYIIKNYNYDTPIEIKYNNKSLGRISDIKFDSKNNIWLSSIGNGIYYINDESIINITTNDGLKSNLLHDIILENDSTIWVGGNKGIDRIIIDPNDVPNSPVEIKNLNESHGINSNYIHAIELWNNYLWAVTNEGICYFDPALMDYPCSSSKTYISNIIIDETKANQNSLPDLRSKRNDIIIEFNNAANNNLDNNGYKYRLVKDNEEEASNWVETNSKTISYSDLSYGDYTFEVTSKNTCGEWNTDCSNMTFVVDPRFNETFLFKVLLALLTLLCAYLVILFQRRRIKLEEAKKRELNEAKLKMQVAELDALRNQINPHFVFNALNSIQNFIFKNDPVSANYYVTKLSKLLRNSLQYTKLDFISLDKEIDFLKNYIELEMMRFPDRFTYKINIDSDILTDEVMIPSLLLQPIVENSIKHGFKHLEANGILEINIDKKGADLLKLVVKDNGRGIDDTSVIRLNEEHKSIGEDIVKNRIELLNKSEFGNRAKINIENKPQKGVGYRVIIELPIKLES